MSFNIKRHIVSRVIFRCIHLGKGQQRPFSSTRCLLFPPWWQTAFQPNLLQFARWNAQLVEIMRPSWLPTLPPQHLRCLTGSNVAGHSQQVTQHHTTCLWASHSATCWHWYSPHVHHKKSAARTIQIQVALLPPRHYSAFCIATIAAPTTSCAPGHTWIPHADRNPSRGPGSAWPCLPSGTKHNLGQNPYQREIIQEIPWVSMLWSMTKTPWAYTQ